MIIESATDAAASALSLGTAVLGLFMALPLFALGSQRRANIWLALFVVSMALLCLADYLGAAGLYRRYPVLHGWLDWPLAAIGTFYYCYVRSMLGLGNGYRQAWLFAPLLAWVLVLLYARLVQPLAMPVAPILLFFQLQAAACALAVLYRLRQYRHALRTQYSSTSGRDLAWLGWLTAVMLVMLAIWIPATLMKGMWDWMMLFGRLLVLYFVGWYGMRQVAVFLPAPDADAGKYARSGMTGAAQELIGQRLALRAQRERDYLDSDLKLGDMAERIGTSPQLLSQYLNEVLDQNFFDYVNGLRIAEVQAMLRDPARGHLPLHDLALAAGFNSRSTFNAAFRKICGMPPSEWRKQHVRTSAPVGPDTRAQELPDTGRCST